MLCCLSTGLRPVASRTPAITTVAVARPDPTPRPDDAVPAASHGIAGSHDAAGAVARVLYGVSGLLRPSAWSAATTGTPRVRLVEARGRVGAMRTRLPAGASGGATSKTASSTRSTAPSPLAALAPCPVLSTAGANGSGSPDVANGRAAAHRLATASAVGTSGQHARASVPKDAAVAEVSVASSLLGPSEGA